MLAESLLSPNDTSLNASGRPSSVSLSVHSPVYEYEDVNPHDSTGSASYSQNNNSSLAYPFPFLVANTSTLDSADSQYIYGPTVARLLTQFSPALVTKIQRNSNRSSFDGYDSDQDYSQLFPVQPRLRVSLLQRLYDLKDRASHYNELSVVQDAIVLGNRGSEFEIIESIRKLLAVSYSHVKWDISVDEINMVIILMATPLELEVAVSIVYIFTCAKQAKLDLGQYFANFEETYQLVNSEEVYCCHAMMVIENVTLQHALHLLRIERKGYRYITYRGFFNVMVKANFIPSHPHYSFQPYNDDRTICSSTVRLTIQITLFLINLAHILLVTTLLLSQTNLLGLSPPTSPAEDEDGLVFGYRVGLWIRAIRYGNIGNFLLALCMLGCPQTFDLSGQMCAWGLKNTPFNRVIFLARPLIAWNFISNLLYICAINGSVLDRFRSYLVTSIPLLAAYLSFSTFYAAECTYFPRGYLQHAKTLGADLLTNWVVIFYVGIMNLLMLLTLPLLCILPCWFHCLESVRICGEPRLCLSAGRKCTICIGWCVPGIM